MMLVRLAVGDLVDVRCGCLRCSVGDGDVSGHAAFVDHRPVVVVPVGMFADERALRVGELPADPVAGFGRDVGEGCASLSDDEAFIVTTGRDERDPRSLSSTWLQSAPTGSPSRLERLDDLVSRCARIASAPAERVARSSPTKRSDPARSTCSIEYSGRTERARFTSVKQADNTRDRFFRQLRL